MMDEVKLKAAAGELEAALIKELPDEKERDHEFSDSFRRKMKKVIFRANHPVMSSGWRRAVAAVLAITLLGGSVLLAVPKARASFVGWVKEVYDSAMHYFVPENATGDNSEEIPTAYHLGWVPEGYALLDILDNPGMVDYIYVDANGVILQFGYSFCENGSSPDVFIGGAEYTMQVIRFGDDYADLYTKKDGLKVGLVWSAYEGRVLFCIAGQMNVDLLIKLAESVAPE